MEVLVFLVPLALTLGAIGLMGFLWSLKNGQYDDLEGAGWRAIADDEPAPKNHAPGQWAGRRASAVAPGLRGDNGVRFTPRVGLTEHGAKFRQESDPACIGHFGGETRGGYGPAMSSGTRRAPGQLQGCGAESIRGRKKAAKSVRGHPSRYRRFLQSSAGVPVSALAIPARH